MPSPRHLPRSSLLLPALAWLLAPASALAEPAPAEPPSSAPPPAHRLAGEATSYKPRLHFPLGPVELELPLSLAGRVEGVSTYPVDRYATPFSEGVTGSPELRVGARIDLPKVLQPFSLHAQYEHDLLTGFAGKDTGVAGEGLPGAEGLTHQLRKAFIELRYKRMARLSFGMMPSHWGMGLVANDGDHRWEPGSAAFLEPRYGDRNLRGTLTLGLHEGLGLVAVLGADIKAHDDLVLPGDSTRQYFGALLLGYGKPHTIGAYVVRRHQEAANGHATDVTVADLTGRTSGRLGPFAAAFEAEAVVVTGTTTLAPTVEHLEHKVLQFAGAARGSLDLGAFGVVADFLYASGDRSPNDDAQHGFHVDPNFPTGLLLFQHVMAAHTGRGVATAADPKLVGVPTDDLERIATRRGATNTASFFPRLRYRPLAGLEVYGGPLFAFAPVENADPFNTQVAGGSPRSALDGRSGRYLGTELDLGVRYRALVHGAELTLGAELGTLRPGNALVAADGSTMSAVSGGRAMARVRF
jgi:hypothetical protein